MNDLYICPKCKIPKTRDNFYKRSGTDRITSYCKLCNTLDKKERYRKFKLECVNYKGGSCQICGYDKCLGALDFHHIDPSIKDREIGDYKTFDINKVKEELDKCILVCANCHREIHYNMLH